MAEQTPGADPEETYHEFDMGLVAAHQNEIARLRKQNAGLLAALEWTHIRIHVPNDDGSMSCLPTCPAHRVLAAKARGGAA